MRAEHFRLQLDAGEDGAIRLVHFQRYQDTPKDKRRAAMTSELHDHIMMLLPSANPHDILQGMALDPPALWDVVCDKDHPGIVTIVSKDCGVRVSPIIRVIERLAPDAFRRPMHYTPLEAPQTRARIAKLN